MLREVCPRRLHVAPDLGDQLVHAIETLLPPQAVEQLDAQLALVAVALEVEQERLDAALVAALRAAEVETVVLAGYMRLVTPGFLRAFPNRVINVHPALLPAFPGLHAQRQAIEYGVKVTGCTVHLVDEGVDTGPIFLQEALPVEEGDDEARLAARIRVVEHRLLVEALRLLAEGRVTVEGRRVRVRRP